MFTYQQQEHAFANATEKQRAMYESHEAGMALARIAKKHGLQTKHVDFAVAIGDVILGLVPQEKLPDLLVERLGITQAEAFRVTADLLDFLAPLQSPAPTDNISATAERDVETKPAPQPAEAKTDTKPEAATQPKANDTLASEIAETEAALNAIPKMRTMAQDANETTTHSSSQSELLNKSNRWTPKE